jgi:hypothetical protein
MNPPSPAATLRGLAQDSTRNTVERCDLCGAVIPAEHAHLMDLQSRQIRCACRACSVLFKDEGSGGRRYRLVPSRRFYLVDFRLDDGQWRALGIPVGLAFLVQDTAAGRVVAYYPSPVGPTEAAPPGDAWEAIVSGNPVLRGMAPDVEALLVNRAGGARDYFLTSIDECFRLCAVVRTYWRGLSGGQDVWGEVGRFFEGLRRRSSHLAGDARTTA